MGDLNVLYVPMNKPRDLNKLDGVTIVDPYARLKDHPLAADFDDPYKNYIFYNADSETAKQRLYHRVRKCYELSETVSEQEVCEPLERLIGATGVKYRSWVGSKKQIQKGDNVFQIVDIVEVNCTKALCRWQMAGRTHEQWVPLKMLESV